MKPKRHKIQREPHPSALAYRTSEAAHVLGVSRSSVYQLFDEKKLPSIRICGRRLVTRAALEAFVAAQ